MEIKSRTRGRLDTIDTIILLEKEKRAERRGVDILVAESKEMVAESMESTSCIERRSLNNDAGLSSWQPHERRVLPSER